VANAIYRSVEPEVSTELAIQQTANSDSVAVALRGYQTVKSNIVLQVSMCLAVLAVGIWWNNIRSLVVRLVRPQKNETKG